MRIEEWDMHDASLRKELGVRVKVLRKAKRWPQKELADLLGIRFQLLNKYESGFITPPAEMLIKLADALNTSTDYLLTGNAAEELALANTRLFKRFQALESLAEDDQQTVIKVIDAMIAKRRMASALTPVDQGS